MKNNNMAYQGSTALVPVDGYSIEDDLELSDRVDFPVQVYNGGQNYNNYENIRESSYGDFYANDDVIEENRNVNYDRYDRPRATYSDNSGHRLIFVFILFLLIAIMLGSYLFYNNGYMSNNYKKLQSILGPNITRNDVMGINRHIAKTTKDKAELMSTLNSIYYYKYFSVKNSEYISKIFFTLESKGFTVKSFNVKNSKILEMEIETLSGNNKNIYLIEDKLQKIGIKKINIGKPVIRNGRYMFSVEANL